jgi:hypothetical protein
VQGIGRDHGAFQRQGQRPADAATAFTRNT